MHSSDRQEQLDCSTSWIFEKIKHIVPSCLPNKAYFISKLQFPFKLYGPPTKDTAHYVDKVIKSSQITDEIRNHIDLIMQENDERLLAFLKAAHLYNENTPARPANEFISQLIVENKITPEQRDELQKLIKDNEHRLLTYLMSQKLVYFLKNIDPKLKKNEEQGKYAQVLLVLETLFNDYYRLQIPEYVPNSNVVIDDNDNYYIVGLLSQALNGFTPNHDQPLTDEDTYVDFETMARVELQQKLVRLSACLNRPTNGVINYAYSFINHKLNPAFAAAQLKPIIDQIIAKKSYYSLEELTYLKTELQRREKHIADDLPPATLYQPFNYVCNYLTQKNPEQKQTSASKEELTLLREILKVVETLIAKQLDPSIWDTDKIETLELIDQQLQNAQITLEDKDDFLPISSLIESDSLANVRTLKNYRCLKSLANILIVSYLEKEDDLHNHNLGRLPEKGYGRFDFDLSNAPISMLFKDFNYPIEKYLRRPSKEKFALTAERIRNFPILNPHPYYWVTTKTFLSPSVINYVSPILKFFENWYTEPHTKVFIKLAHNPIFEFHKYDALLRRLLTSTATYEALNKLRLKPFETDSSPIIKQLPTLLSEDKEETRCTLRSVLKEMPEFQAFLANHGAFSLQASLKKFAAYKEALRDPDDLTGCRAKEACYQELYDSIDLDAMKADYQKLYQEAGADKKIEALEFMEDDVLSKQDCRQPAASSLALG